MRWRIGIMWMVILSSILLFCSVLNAQYTITSGTGKTITSGTGKMITGYSPVRYGVVSTPTPPVDYAVDTVDFFDFESEPPGDWTEAEQQTYFNARNGYQYQQDYETCDIVEMDWDGEERHTLRIEHKTDELWHGYGIEGFLSDTVTEIYMRYRWKFGENYNAGKDGKMPGFDNAGDLESGTVGWDEEDIRPDQDMPWEWKVGWKGGGILQSYMYDDSDQAFSNGYVPWGNNEDSVLLFYGTPYDIIIRNKMTTFTGTTSNDDGIFEAWVNGKKVLEETELTHHWWGYDTVTYGINAMVLSNFFGGSDTTTKPMRTCYGYMTDLLFYRDTANDTWGQVQTNPDDDILDYPGAMSAQDFYVDSIIDIETENVTSVDYPSATPYYTNYRWLVVAPEGYVPQVDFETGDYTYGSMNHLIFMDGKGWGATELDRVVGSDPDLGNNFDGNGTVTATGRYMFISYVTGYNGWGNQVGGAFSAEVTFIPD